mgnify:CR=1 FL=1
MTLVAFSEIGWHTSGVPPESECYLVIAATSLFQAHCCCHSVRMGHNSLDVDSHVVFRIRIGANTSSAHDSGHICIFDELVTKLGIIEDTYGLILGHVQRSCPHNN